MPKVCGLIRTVTLTYGSWRDGGSWATVELEDGTRVIIRPSREHPQPSLAGIYDAHTRRLPVEISW